MDRKECLDTAAKCVLGDRTQTYGPPEDSFGRIAELWSVYLGTQVTAGNVAAMMILLKVARGGDHLDNWVDIAGYAACGAEICTRKET